MRQRSNLVVAIGLALFLVGASAAWLVVHDEGSSSANTAASQVLYAAKPVPAGISGQAALSQGLVKTRKVDPAAKPATAFSDQSELVGRTSQVDIPAGMTLVADQFQAAQTTSGTVNIPAGKEALAVQLSNVPGVAGFAGAGDHIDVFGMVRDKSTAAGQPNAGAGVHRVMQGVEVLKVNGTTLVANQGQPGGPGLVFLLAVTPEQAEHLVFLTSFEQLYFALVPKTNPPTAVTPGVDPKTVLNQI